MTPLDVLHKRHELRQAIREFFFQRSYLEVDTPIGVICPGLETNLNYFKTHWIDYKNVSHPLWLRSSPELHMKQALSFGAKKIFQISPCFRNNGELSEWHHPEFTMLEWYETRINWENMVEDTEALINFCFAKLNKTSLTEKSLHFKKISVYDAFKQFADIELIDQDKQLCDKARTKGYHSVNPTDDFETSFFKILIDKIEPVLKKMPGVVLYDYPPSQAALAKVEDGRAKRFEFYLNGIELSNGFFELTDPIENKRRFQQSNDTRKSQNRETISEDPDFFSLLEKGLPESCGNALGFDRLLACILLKEDISEILPYRNNLPYNLSYG